MTDLTPGTATLETTEAPASVPAPRTRWAAVIWGLAFAAISSGALWIVTFAVRREQFSEWLTALSPAALGGYAVLAIGSLLLIAGVVGVIRRAQQTRTLTR